MDAAVRIRVLDVGPEDRGTMVFLGHDRRRLDAEGRVRFPFVRLGSTPQLWIAGLSEGRYVWVKEQRITSEEIVVRPEVGGIIRGRVQVPHGVELESLSLWPFAPLACWVEEEPTAGSLPWTSNLDDLTFEVRGVPPGEWFVSVWGKEGDEEYKADFTASPGDDVLVVLR